MTVSMEIPKPVEIFKLEGYIYDSTIQNQKGYSIVLDKQVKDYSINFTIAEFESFEDAVDLLKEFNSIISEIIKLLPEVPLMEKEKYILIRFQNLIQFTNIDNKDQISDELFAILMKILSEYIDFLNYKHILIEEDSGNFMSKKAIPKYKSKYSSFFSKFIDLETEFYDFMKWEDDPMNEAVRVAYDELR